MKTSSEFRASARQALSGKWRDAVLAGFLASLLGALSSSGPSLNFEFNFGSAEEDIPLDQMLESIIEPEMLGILIGAFAAIFAVALVVSVVMFIVGSLVAPGYAKFNLNLIDGEKPDIKTLFDHFHDWKRLVIANLLRTAFVFLWSLLFVIPGIIAAYRYSMLNYILAEDPDISPKDALEKSKEMMRGNKMKLFCLEFSFIGWDFLSALTFGIGSLWLTPYQQAAYADFYRETSNTRPTDVSLDELLQLASVEIEPSEYTVADVVAPEPNELEPTEATAPDIASPETPTDTEISQNSDDTTL